VEVFFGSAAGFKFNSLSHQSASGRSEGSCFTREEKIPAYSSNITKKTLSTTETMNPTLTIVNAAESTAGNERKEPFLLDRLGGEGTFDYDCRKTFCRLDGFFFGLDTNNIMIASFFLCSGIDCSRRYLL
jgi:hypothetical protein